MIKTKGQNRIAKKGKNYWAKKGCELAKRIKRETTFSCEICGKSGNFKREIHHLLTVGAHKNISNYLPNLICLCVHCHLFGKISFHGSGTDLMNKKLNKLFPDRIRKLRQDALKRKNVNYEAEYEELKRLN